MLSAAPITTESVAAAVARGLRAAMGDRASAVKRTARRLDADPRAVKDHFAGARAPKAETLVRMIAEFDEVADEVLALAGRSPGRAPALDGALRLLRAALALLDPGSPAASGAGRIAGAAA